jgi:Fic family protein
VLLGEDVHAPAKVLTEVLNAKAAIDWARERVLDGAPLDVEDLRAMHRLFTADLPAEHSPGDFRPGPAVIGDQFIGSGWGDYKAPPAATVPARLEALLHWLSQAGDDPHPVIAAGIAHQEIASIRPFTLATGQTARLVSRMVLGLHGYSFHDALALGTYYLDDRSAYHAALDNGRSYLERARASRDDWLAFYLRGLLNETDRITAEIASMRVEGSGYAHHPPLRRDEAALLAFAAEYGSFTLHDATSILSPTPKRTVVKRLAAMVAAGELVEDAAGAEPRYSSGVSSSLGASVSKPRQP